MFFSAISPSGNLYQINMPHLSPTYIAISIPAALQWSWIPSNLHLFTIQVHNPIFVYLLFFFFSQSMSNSTNFLRVILTISKPHESLYLGEKHFLFFFYWLFPSFMLSPTSTICMSGRSHCRMANGVYFLWQAFLSCSHWTDRFHSIKQCLT